MHVSVCVCVCVTTAAGVVSTVAGSTVSGYVDGVGTVAKFNGPNGISVDSTGNVWVADRYNYMIRQINTAGRVHTYIYMYQYTHYIVHVACVCSCVSVCGGVSEVCGCDISMWM